MMVKYFVKFSSKLRKDSFCFSLFIIQFDNLKNLLLLDSIFNILLTLQHPTCFTHLHDSCLKALLINIKCSIDGGNLCHRYISLFIVARHITTA